MGGRCALPSCGRTAGGDRCSSSSAGTWGLEAPRGWESSVSTPCPSGCKCTSEHVRTILLVSLLTSCPYERKGKTPSISRGAKCLQLPLTLVGDPDAQLICSDPPQNADSFIPYVRGCLLELAKAKQKTVLSMQRRIYQLFSRFVIFACHL